jgi:nicastrin
MAPAALLLLLVGLAAGQRIRDSIYSDIQQIRPCFRWSLSAGLLSLRRLNGTQEVGCSSALGGNVGVVAYLEQESDLEALDPAFGPYVLLVDPAILSGELLRRARATGQVAGVVLPSVTEGNWTGEWCSSSSLAPCCPGHYPAGGYSADASCPNAASSLYAGTSQQCSELSSPWNPSGTGTMWEDWGFPIFLVQEAAATEGLLDCWLHHNQPPLGWPLCSVELKANMYAAKDSEVRPSVRPYPPSPDLHPPVQPVQPDPPDHVRPAR